MLLIVFNIGKDRFGLDVSQIIEVIPLVTFKKVHRTPKYVSGIFNYRGTMVPVIDLSTLISGKPSQPLLSTRVILVNYTSPDNHHTLGLVAERVTETMVFREEDFKPPVIESDTTRYLGDIMTTEDGMIQRITIENILPEYLRKILFSTKKET